MTSSHSPPAALKAQADRIALLLKAGERGQMGKLAEARKRESIKFGIAMDDKFVSIEMPWSVVRDCDVAGISEWIVQRMSGERPSLQ